MTEGTPLRLLIAFTIPMLIGNLFQQFYNMVDSIVVGKYVGANALASVGVTGSINFFFFSLSSGIAVGIGIIVSQYFGAGDEKQVQKTIANSVFIILGTAVFMGLIGAVFARQVLVLLSTPMAILDDAVTYMQICCGGLVAVAAYNGISSILRALGDSKTPLIFLVVASVINVVLDLIFVIEFGWSVFGVGLATVISQFVAAVGSILYAYIKIPYFKIPKKYYRLDQDILVRCLRLGLPVALQYSLISISCIAQQWVVNGFGEITVAAFTATGRIEQLVHQPYMSLSTALATFTGQNIGAGKIARVRKGFWTSMKMTAVFSILMLFISVAFAEQIIHIFVDDPAVIAMGAKGLRIISLCYLPLGTIYMTRNILNGAGDVNFSMASGFVEVFGRVGFSKPLTMIPFLGVWGIWITTGLTWTITAVVGFVRYSGGRWKYKSIVEGETISTRDAKKCGRELTQEK